MPNPQPIERRLQFAGSFLILALLIEAFTILWTRPVAFVVFVALGGVLFVAGILLYLYSLVRVKAVASSNTSRTSGRDDDHRST
jgi:membrane protein implicated in regulation of membrane protease activity